MKPFRWTEARRTASKPIRWTGTTKTAAKPIRSTEATQTGGPPIGSTEAKALQPGLRCRKCVPEPSGRPRCCRSPGGGPERSDPASRLARSRSTDGPAVPDANPIPSIVARCPFSAPSDERASRHRSEAGSARCDRRCLAPARPALMAGLSRFPGSVRAGKPRVQSGSAVRGPNRHRVKYAGSFPATARFPGWWRRVCGRSPWTSCPRSVQESRRREQLAGSRPKEPPWSPLSGRRRAPGRSRDSADR